MVVKIFINSGLLEEKTSKKMDVQYIIYNFVYYK